MCVYINSFTVSHPVLSATKAAAVIMQSPCIDWHVYYLRRQPCLCVYLFVQKLKNY